MTDTMVLQVGDGLSGWTIKYYKGLGTSSSQEAKEYFSNLPLHQMDFAWEGAESGEVLAQLPPSLPPRVHTACMLCLEPITWGFLHGVVLKIFVCGDCMQVIEMVFSKKRADDRKAWLLKYEADLYVDHK